MKKERDRGGAASVHARLLRGARSRGEELQRVLTRLQVDIGFGDAIGVAVEEVEIPSLLDLPSPRVRAYRREQVIAEKLHAIVELGLLNTRMKDYFDIHGLSRSFAFEAIDMRRAIEATFGRRKTALPRGVPPGLEDVFGREAAKVAQWRAFVRQIGVETSPDGLPGRHSEARPSAVRSVTASE